MTAEPVSGAVDAQQTPPEFVRVRVRVLGKMISICLGIRDAYYGRIDELERRVCAP